MSTTHLPPPRPQRPAILAAAVLPVLVALTAATIGPAVIIPTSEATHPVLPDWFLPRRVLLQAIVARPHTAYRPAAEALPAQSSGDICSVLNTTACNSVIEFNTRDPAHARAVWDDYLPCVDRQHFPEHTLVYSETGYAVQLTTSRDLGLSVPLVPSKDIGGVEQAMNVFAGIFSACDDEACVAGSETKDSFTYRHAIRLAAPAGVYTAIIDSDNMTGIGHAIIACGNSNPGWCASVVRSDLPCGSYTIQDTTLGAPDQIIHYDAPYGLDRFVFDGPERVYRLQLSGPRVFQLTLHYDGDLRLPYNNYMTYFLLDSACDQRPVVGHPLPPNNPILGDGIPASTTGGTHILGPGTYYLVIDGIYLLQGDDFALQVDCHTVSLPLLLADEVVPPW